MLAVGYTLLRAWIETPTSSPELEAPDVVPEGEPPLRA